MLRWLGSVSLGALAAVSLAGQAPDFSGVPTCATATKQVEKLWCAGSTLFMQHDSTGYAKAIEPYSRALALEKRHRVLGRNAWFVLVDNLGMAYGITGDLPRAKATFEYGLSLQPKYPMFYYNLACTYAGMGDQARTISYLRLAFANRANMIRGEDMPDPRTDDSFQGFMKDSTFVDAVAHLPGIAP